MDAQQNSDLAHVVLEHFARFVTQDMTLPMFKHWVYNTPDIADVIGYDQYVQLLDQEYSLPSASDHVRRIVIQLTNQVFPNELEREHVRLVLCDFVHGRLSVFESCARLVWWRNNGVSWIPVVFVGIDSELDNAPRPDQYHHWEPEALAAKLAEVEPWVAKYHALALAEARHLLAVEFSQRQCT